MGAWGPCRYTLWPIRALSIPPLADSGLVDIPFGRFWPCPRGGAGRLFLNSGFLRRLSRDSGYLGLCSAGSWLPRVLQGWILVSWGVQSMDWFPRALQGWILPTWWLQGVDSGFLGRPSMGSGSIVLLFSSRDQLERLILQTLSVSQFSRSIVLLFSSY